MDGFECLEAIAALFNFKSHWKAVEGKVQFSASNEYGQTWKRQYEMPACRKGSKNNLRSDKQIQFKGKKSKLGERGRKYAKSGQTYLGKNEKRKRKEGTKLRNLQHEEHH